jgi:carboxyl-terminal processing protease
MRKKILILSCVSILLLIQASAVFSKAQEKKDNLYKQVDLFSDAITIIRSEYVDEPVSKDLIYGALKGMLASLDPYSQFMDPESFNELKSDTEGKFGGIGIEISIKDGLVTVITPIEGTPAWKLGLKPNDRIVKINNELTREMVLSDAVKKLRGKPGEAVDVTILRESEKKILEFKIVRDIIKVKDIKNARILEGGIGYIRLVEFRENTPKDLDSTLDKLLKEGMDALIVDLRNNPGGLLDKAVRVSEKFVEKGKVIVYTKGRKESQNMEFISQNQNPLLDLPLVILINEGSASGSEIVAGALQDYKRAIVVGVKSYGKGSVQTVIPLGDGSALRLTTSKYFTPLGRQIHGKGIEPDIIAEEGSIKLAEKKDELGLPEKNQEAIFESVANNDLKGEGKALVETFDYKSDNQIMRAIDVIRTVKFYKKNTK